MSIVLQIPPEVTMPETCPVDFWEPLIQMRGHYQAITIWYGEWTLLRTQCLSRGTYDSRQKGKQHNHTIYWSQFETIELSNTTNFKTKNELIVKSKPNPGQLFVQLKPMSLSAWVEATPFNPPYINPFLPLTSSNNQPAALWAKGYTSPSPNKFQYLTADNIKIRGSETLLSLPQTHQPLQKRDVANFPFVLTHKTATQFVKVLWAHYGKAYLAFYGLEFW